MVSSAASALNLDAGTLDVDALGIIPSYKREAMNTFRSASGTKPGERGCQPLNVFVPEAGMLLYGEMRFRGDVQAREGNARVLAEPLGPLPERITEVMLRGPFSVGHCVHWVIRPCNRPAPGQSAETQRFGVIGFSISAVRSETMMKAVLRVPDSATIATGNRVASVPPRRSGQAR